MAISNPGKGKKKLPVVIKRKDSRYFANKKRAVMGLGKSVQMCTAKIVFLSQTSMFSLFFIQFYF
jgi:hypothetical protein